MEVSDQLHAPTALLLRERAPGTHWIGYWVGPRAGLDVVKNSHALPRLKLPIIQTVAQRYTTELSRLLTGSL
jgi:hypothetical protein